MSKQNVTLSRALKEKNRLAGRLAQLRKLIDVNNSRDEDIPREIDVRATLVEAQKVMDTLVEVKSAIAKANHGIVQSIIELEETKSQIAWLKELDTNCCTRRDWTPMGEKVHHVTAIVGGLEKIQTLQLLQKKANALQDKLDEFNARTHVTIEIED